MHMVWSDQALCVSAATVTSRSSRSRRKPSCGCRARAGAGLLRIPSFRPIMTWPGPLEMRRKSGKLAVVSDARLVVITAQPSR